jgi:hypothetical protein
VPALAPRAPALGAADGVDIGFGRAINSGYVMGHDDERRKKATIDTGKFLGLKVAGHILQSTVIAMKW